MNTVDLLLHPVRLRIVQALSGGRELTTTQLCAGLPDVSKVTVYRQVRPSSTGVSWRSPASSGCAGLSSAGTDCARTGP
ncbi:helix-turn-helix domain-containing protein [Amycolatopsis sp. NPDC051128]|uniref:helix-turn-helix domain-containing protein n=1 Tax=Amycolatopsis sp. NPDC051128 TaxID=3155412 RepID=UPI00341AA47D